MTVFPQRLLTVMSYWTRNSFIPSVAIQIYVAGSVIWGFPHCEPFLQKLVLCWPLTSLEIQCGKNILLGHLLVVGGINPFRKFGLLFSNPLSKFCVQLHLPPSTNEWKGWRTLRVQVAKTGTIAKALFKSGDINFILTYYWDGFPNQFGGFAMLKNMPIVLKTRNRVLWELVPIPVLGQLQDLGRFSLSREVLLPSLLDLPKVNYLFFKQAPSFSI